MGNALHNVGAATENICLRKTSTSSHEGNLVVIHHLIAADGLYTRVTDQVKKYKISLAASEVHRVEQG